MSSQFTQVRESLRLQYRFLDIRREEFQHTLRLRSALLLAMRQFLCLEQGIDIRDL